MMRARIAAALLLCVCASVVPADAASWLKWDEATWLDLASIRTVNGLTIYEYLMLNQVVTYPAEGRGNHTGRFNCRTGESWEWVGADPDDRDGMPTRTSRTERTWRRHRPHEVGDDGVNYFSNRKSCLSSI